ncbi:MAG TPA: GntR family transcriptional regulator [Candidatus Saccharimonadales bacterium]|nr:GntR family transcriptional regulator [Candidatus Saccharimonadales bacterium]
MKSTRGTLRILPDPLDQFQPVVRDPRPLSAQIAEQIHQLISNGALSPGGRLPTETGFASRFRVGRTTVREALKLLENDGLIQVKRGRGRFVSASPLVRRPLTRLEGVTEMMEACGYDVTNRVVSVTIERPTQDEKRVLQLPEGAEVIRLERLRLHHGEPYIFSLDVIPRLRFAEDIGALDWSGSLLELLRARGASPAYAVARVSAVHMPRALLRRHNLAQGVPWLLMIQTNTTEEGIPVIYSHDYHRGDCFAFDVLRQVERRS